jgi:hypothetical protein
MHMKKEKLLWIVAVSMTLIHSEVHGADPQKTSNSWNPASETPVQVEKLKLSPNGNKQLRANGLITSSLDLQSVLAGILNVNELDAQSAYVLNVVKWNGTGSAVLVDQWYLYDTGETTTAGTWSTDSDVIKRACISGKKNIILVYLRIPNGSSDITANTKPPIAYLITNTQEDTTPIANLKALATLVGVPGSSLFSAQITGLEIAPEEWFSAFNKFTTDFDASSWEIQATFPQKEGDAIGEGQSPAKASSASVTFTDEGKTWWDVGMAYPVSSYKDVVLSGSAPDAVMPQSATRQSFYATFDVFVPEIQPQLENLRWLPHPFLALPISGKVFEHPMGGVALSAKYFELFSGVVWDRENSPHPTWKGIFGIKLTVSDVKTLLNKSKSSNSSQ